MAQEQLDTEGKRVPMAAGLSRSRLDTFVEAHTEEPFYYSREWHDLIRRVYGYAVIPLVATNSSGQITGFLPLCRVRSRLSGTRLVSLPFSDSCPLLAIDEESANALVDRAIRIAREERVKYLELRTGNHDVLAGRSDLVAGNGYVQSIVRLAADSEVMWQRMHNSVRKAIKKAEKLGVQVREAQDRSGMDLFYRLHLMTRSTKHGVPVQPRRYFAELWDTFASSGAIHVWLAEYQGEVIAGVVSITSGTTYRAVYSASDPSYLLLRGNQLLVWAEIQWAGTNGYRVLDFGRTATDNEGLRQIKRRYGAIEVPLPYYYYPDVAGAVSTPESNLKYQIFTKLWRRLPLQVAGPLGGYLYPHLA